jgi:uncharacterized protein
VTQPAIYYGEMTDNWVISRTRQPEFDYPSGEQNIFTTVRGQRRRGVGGILRRALFASYLGSLKVFLSNDITSESRIMYHRSIAQRVRKAMPFLTFDGDPYLVIGDDGRMHWIVDAYTTTDKYPYSMALRDGTNLHAQQRQSGDRRVSRVHRAFVVDSTDAMIRTYSRAFPGIFRPLAEMPEDMQRHIRYPTDLFRVQNAVYSTYHMLDPHTFYHREDQWEIPTIGRTGGERDIEFMRHIIMRLPGEDDAEFVYMTPFTPRGKHNLAAWLAARSDAPELRTI